MVAVVARHAEKSELFSAGERAHPTNEQNKLENSVCGTSSDIQPIARLSRPGKCASDRTAWWGSLWLAKFDALKPERDALAEELRELYPDAVAKIVYSFVRIPPVITRRPSASGSPPGTPR
jgi:hypothetical protein